MTPFVAGFDENELGLACLSFMSHEHVNDIAGRGPEAVFRALTGDRGIEWERFIQGADFNTDPLLQSIMVDRAINPIMMAVEAVINNEWTKRHFDQQRMSDSDRYHLYRLRHFSIVHGSMVPCNRLAVDLLVANRQFAGACWMAFNDQKPVDFATEDAMMTPDQVRAILANESVRESLQLVAKTFEGVTLRSESDHPEGENAHAQIARLYEHLIGMPLCKPSLN